MSLAAVGNHLKSRYLISLQYLEYRKLWSATVCSQSAAWALIVARMALVFQITGSSNWTGAVTFAAMIPGVFMSPVAGYLADRFDRRKVLVAAYSINLSLSIVLAVLVVTGTGERAFCTGADPVEQHRFCVDKPNAYWKWMGALIEVHEKLRNIGKSMVARLNGMVVGGRNEVNLSCDPAIAADDVYIRQVGAARGSVAAAGATQIIVGDRRA